MIIVCYAFFYLFMLNFCFLLHNSMHIKANQIICMIRTLRSVFLQMQFNSLLQKPRFLLGANFSHQCYTQKDAKKLIIQFFDWKNKKQKSSQNQENIRNRPIKIYHYLQGLRVPESMAIFIYLLRNLFVVVTRTYELTFLKNFFWPFYLETNRITRSSPNYKPSIVVKIPKCL